MKSEEQDDIYAKVIEYDANMNWVYMINSDVPLGLYTGDFDGLLFGDRITIDQYLTKPIIMSDKADELEELTFGQKAVGLTFNPSGDNEVANCKQGFAYEIDRLNDFRLDHKATPGQKRHASIAITMIEDAQKRAVQALTWKD